MHELALLVASSPELPSVMQHWIDQDAASAGLVVACSPRWGDKTSNTVGASRFSVHFHLARALRMRIVSPMVSVEDLGQEIAELSVRLDAATHRLLACIRQFDAANGWGAQGALTCAHWLSWRVGLDLATARERVRVARALGVLPAIDGALAAGTLSYAKVRALTRVATPANEATLLEMALCATGGQLERICRGYRSARGQDDPIPPEARSLRRRPLPGGMVKLEIVLSPDEADLVARALDRAREVEHAHASAEASATLTREGDQADVSAESAQKTPASRLSVRHVETSDEEASPPPAWPSRAAGLVTLAQGFLAGHPVGGNGGERFQVIIHVDQDPLAEDGTLSATLDDGTRVAAEALRRVACDCGLVAMAGTGEELNVGRRTRSIPPAIRRVLHERDRGCRFPGCTHQRFLHGHHVRHWLHGGETSVDNVVLLCTYHHRLVHEGGWQIERDEEGQWRFVAPNGGRMAGPARREVAGDSVAWLGGWAAERGLDLSPDTNQPRWDGTPPDYDVAVAGLLAEG